MYTHKSKQSPNTQLFYEPAGNLKGVVGVAELGIQGPAHLGAQVLQPHFVTLRHMRQHTVHGFGLDMWWLGEVGKLK